MCAYEAKGCQAVHMRRGARRWLKRVVMIEMCTHAGGYYEVYTEAFGCVSGFGVPRAGCGPDALRGALEPLPALHAVCARQAPPWSCCHAAIGCGL